MNIKFTGLLVTFCMSAACLSLNGRASAASLDKTGGADNLGAPLNMAQAGASTISGTITASLPDGAAVTVVVSTDYFRNNSTPTFFFFTITGGSLLYTATLPAPATYYISAVGEKITEKMMHGQESPSSSAPIGVFNDYSPIYLRQGTDITGADFIIEPDTIAPSISIISPSEGARLSTLYRITGFASDNKGVASIEAALRDLTTGLWWSAELGSWISNNTPLYHDVYAFFSGPPETPAWTINSGGRHAGLLTRIDDSLIKEHSYRIYFRAIDFAANLQLQPSSVSFYWIGQPDSGSAGQIIDTSSATWRRYLEW